MDILKNTVATSATRQVRQQCFSVCIFSLRQFFGLAGNLTSAGTICNYEFLKDFGADQPVGCKGFP